ncbi:hypothetical protein GTW46_38805 [Streptomyces sp. SID6013]|nr:hypothetical protein [Streptomyces sp. SID6013]
MKSTDGVSDDLHVHPVTAVLLGEVRQVVTYPVAFGECAVEQDVLGFLLSQDPQ